jgi:hypothetical protein
LVLSEPLPSAPPDYAEALINPIKHVSLMDQRAKQLAALIGESEVSLVSMGAGLGGFGLAWMLGPGGRHAVGMEVCDAAS